MQAEPVVAMLPPLLAGTDPSDHAYIAVTAFADLLLMPLWVLVLWFRTWVWMMTFGVVFRRKRD
jgi:hypothetical protein